MAWGSEVKSCRLCQTILRIVVGCCSLTPHDHFLKLADIDVRSSDAVYLPDDVPEHLNFFLLSLDLVTEVINHRLVFSSQLPQAHLANID